MGITEIEQVGGTGKMITNLLERMKEIVKDLEHYENSAVSDEVTVSRLKDELLRKEADITSAHGRPTERR